MAGYITCFQCAWLEASKLCGTHHHHVASSPCMAGSHRHSRSLCRSKDANLVLHVAPRGPLELQPQLRDATRDRGRCAGCKSRIRAGLRTPPSVTSSWRPCAVAEQEPRLHLCGDAVAGRLGNKMQLACFILEMNHGE